MGPIRKADRVRRTIVVGLIALIPVLIVAGRAPAQTPTALPVDPTAAPARHATPVVLTGADVPTWSRLGAVGAASPHVSGPPGVPGSQHFKRCEKGEGAGCLEDVVLKGTFPARDIRDAHDGTLTVPSDVRRGVAVGDIAAFRWTGSAWEEIPVQVDERFPFFLANWNSGFAPYSGTDEELTYAWDAEGWRKTGGACRAEYPAGQGPVPDPVPTLDDDDEIVFMASDSGTQAPPSALGPPGTGVERQEVALVDPLAPSTARYVYLFTRPGGSSFDESSGYVGYRRDPDADQWVDRASFPESDPEKLGTSNTGYGPNLSGPVCDADGAVRESEDRFARDGATVTTDTYRWRATGRWMVREMRITKPGATRAFGPDLIDRWKGRAFQQNPDSSVSVVGFEDEQVNWEANSTLLGERAGPVRALREVWGADSGTNVTKTETFYRDAVVYRYRLRVHPIPPDGIYTSWDYNAGVATRYYTAVKPAGVPIDGKPDEVVPQVDRVGPANAYFDVPDPTLNAPVPMSVWEQVSGKGDAGSLVYLFELMNPLSLQNPLVAPYYRDDACFDDGTGDDPVARPWPGEPSTDDRVREGYATRAGKPYDDLGCGERQGAWGSHGIHFFVTGDTDNAFTGKPVNEVDSRQWQFAVPSGEPRALGEPYANAVRFPLRPVARTQPSSPGSDDGTAGAGGGTGGGAAAVADQVHGRGVLPATGGGAAILPLGLLAVLFARWSAPRGSFRAFGRSPAPERGRTAERSPGGSRQ